MKYTNTIEIHETETSGRRQVPPGKSSRLFAILASALAFKRTNDTLEGRTRHAWLWAATRAIVIALAGWTASAAAELTPDCPTYVYLGNDPDTDSPDWSEQAQGVANDGHHWFFTSKDGGLFKYDPNWQAVDGGDDVGKLINVKFPPVLVQNYDINHFGDPDYYAGYVFVPFEGDHQIIIGIDVLTDLPIILHQPRAVIAAFRASDLAFVDWVDVLPFQPKAGWVAIDPVERTLYTSDDHLNASAPFLLRYPLDVSKVENGVNGDFLTAPPSQITVLETDGSPIASEFVYMQGGVFTPWGDLYLSVGKSTDSASSTRGGLHLFRRTSDGSASQLVQSSVNESHEPNDPVFAYEYHPGGLSAHEEPEGIDWWNRDHVPGSRYHGQLHAILLNNDLTDDQVWLKHYQVDYSACIGNADTDGDGLPDVLEAYFLNTHPLLPDSDLDGQSDKGEILCSSDPLDPESLSLDIDGDNLPDCIDADDDNDGQSDADELACGSDPHDSASLSPDLDGDGLPDCLDADGDDDGVPNTIDACPFDKPVLELDADSNGCTDTIAGLEQIVQGLQLKSNVANGLLAKLEDAQTALASGNIRVAENKLLDFIQQVDGQRGKALTSAETDLLAAYAANILEILRSQAG